MECTRDVRMSGVRMSQCPVNNNVQLSPSSIGCERNASWPAFFNGNLIWTFHTAKWRVWPNNLLYLTFWQAVCWRVKSSYEHFVQHFQYHVGVVLDWPCRWWLLFCPSKEKTNGRLLSEDMIQQFITKMTQEKKRNSKSSWYGISRIGHLVPLCHHAVIALRL